MWLAPESMPSRQSQPHPHSLPQPCQIAKPDRENNKLPGKSSPMGKGIDNKRTEGDEVDWTRTQLITMILIVTIDELYNLRDQAVW